MASQEKHKGNAAEFHEAMVSIFRRALREIRPPYRARHFLAMVVELGGVEAAKRLLHADEEQSGFTRLWEAKRLALSVEAHVVLPDYSHLFAPDELAIASERLHKYGYQPKA